MKRAVSASLIITIIIVITIMKIMMMMIIIIIIIVVVVVVVVVVIIIIKNSDNNNDIIAFNNDNNNNIIALKGTVRDFLQSLHFSNTYTQVAQVQSCAYHVQDIERLSRATVACHVVRRDSSAIKFDTVEFAVILSSFH